MFVYENGGATVGVIICASSTLAMTFQSDDDIIRQHRLCVDTEQHHVFYITVSAEIIFI